MDVVGLYPHIPHEEGLEALEKVMRKSDGELPVEKLVSLARVVLENNYFEFDEKLFCQKLGMALWLLELCSLWVMQIFWRNFWIAVNLGPGYGGDFWLMFLRFGFMARRN
jgi:hypothetical protein